MRPTQSSFLEIVGSSLTTCCFANNIDIMFREYALHHALDLVSASLLAADWASLPHACSRLLEASLSSMSNAENSVPCLLGTSLVDAQFTSNFCSRALCTILQIHAPPHMAANLVYLSCYIALLHVPLLSLCLLQTFPFTTRFVHPS